jgi:phage baseplate assembly protein W
MGAGTTTLADVTSADWSLALDQNASPGSGIGNVVQGVHDVNQCLQIILTTPKGSDPLRPTFGADVWRYIDAPMNAAIPAIVREVTEAILRWEPRVTVVSISATPISGGDTQGGAQLSIAVTWKLTLSAQGSPPSILAQTQIVKVTIPAS